MKNEMVEECSTYGETRGAYKVLVGKYEVETTWKALALKGGMMFK